MIAAVPSTPFAISLWSLTPLVAGVVLVLLLAVLGKVPVRYNVRNLSVRWRTTLMTPLASTLVVRLMIVSLPFVNGMYKLTQGSGQPANVLVLSEGSTDE